MCEQGNMAQYAAYQNEFMKKYNQYVKQDKMLDQKSAKANIQVSQMHLQMQKMATQSA